VAWRADTGDSLSEEQPKKSGEKKEEKGKGKWADVRGLKGGSRGVIPIDEKRDLKSRKIPKKPRGRPRSGNGREGAKRPGGHQLNGEKNAYLPAEKGGGGGKKSDKPSVNLISSLPVEGETNEFVWKKKTRVGIHKNKIRVVRRTIARKLGKSIGNIWTPKVVDPEIGWGGETKDWGTIPGGGNQRKRTTVGEGNTEKVASRWVTRRNYLTPERGRKKRRKLQVSGHTRKTPKRAATLT